MTIRKTNNSLASLGAKKFCWLAVSDWTGLDEIISHDDLGRGGLGTELLWYGQEKQCLDGDFKCGGLKWVMWRLDELSLFLIGGSDEKTAFKTFFA